MPSIKSQYLNFVKSNLIEILNTSYALSVTSVVEVKQHHNYLIVRSWFIAK